MSSVGKDMIWVFFSGTGTVTKLPKIGGVQSRPGGSIVKLNAKTMCIHVISEGCMAIAGWSMMYDYMMAYMAGAASIFIGYGQTHKVSARLAIGMRRILLGGGIAVTEIPFPSANDSVAGRQVSKMNGLVVWIWLKNAKFGMTNTGCCVMYYNMMAHMAGTACIIHDGQTDEICTRGSVGMRGILIGGGVTIPKIPFPGDNYSVGGGLVCEINDWLSWVRLVRYKGGMALMWRRMCHHHMVAKSGCTIWIVCCDRKADIIGAGRSVRMCWVLFGTGIAIAEIPFVTCNVSIGCRLVIEDYSISICGEMKARRAMVLCISLLERKQRTQQ